jgi:hypothetical protein
MKLIINAMLGAITGLNAIILQTVALVVGNHQPQPLLLNHNVRERVLAAKV